jgi:alkyl sulfatase BDS1-like metallo-beta-lactamase superfamily hydrolase
VDDEDERRRPKPASRHTVAANAAVAASLDLDDPADWARVAQGRIAGPASPQVLHDGGWPVWDLDAFGFLDEADPPPTVNPSLWRQARLNREAGLFEVAPGIVQVRGLDLSNLTVVEGREGRIVVDPLTSAETARAALDLVEAHLGARPVHTVVYTHSHVDHFAGVRGVVDEADVDAGRVQIVAPAGFLGAAVAENVVAGNVMTRRASYMYGALLPRGPFGHVDAGLGKGVPLLGSPGLLAPTHDITATGTEMVIDGVRMVFQLTPDTEAPAEMNFLFPDHRALCMAENCTANLHNLYTPRGALVRDALAWSKYINEAIELFADRADVVFASHHWPRWGAEDMLRYLRTQRDTYRYLHDQVLRLANHGQTMVEIAEELDLPPSLAGEHASRGYYGTVNHNAKAVYQRYLGWFDANPAHLHPHPPAAVGRRYVALAGGPEALMAHARDAFDDGDYRWVVEVVNHLVFADPDHTDARLLQADALEQLGYQAESGPWRGFYLTGAQELRHGHPAGGGRNSVGEDTVRAMTTEMLFDYLGVRLNGPEADGRRLIIEVEVTDRAERWRLGLEHGAVHAVPLAGAAWSAERGVDGTRPDEASATRAAGTAEVDCRVRLTHDALASLVLGTLSTDELVAAGGLVVDGDGGALETLFGLLDTFTLWFPIVTP